MLHEVITPSFQYGGQFLQDVDVLWMVFTFLLVTSWFSTSGGQIMHPRNKYYKNPANFTELGSKYPAFAKYLLPASNGCTINFKDPRAVRELTATLLHHDFGLDIELPLDRLIPTITLRLNYIHWIEDLLQKLPDTGDLCPRGIDIGAGASCIYPLLGAKINGWKFIASEVDEISYRFACSNVTRNDLTENIEVRLVPSQVILCGLLNEEANYHFSMCNPPFFADNSEVVGNHSRTGTRPQPSSVCTGNESETVTSGGEVKFIGRIIEDSLELRSRVKWYTSMVGKKSSLASVLAKLKEKNITKIVTTEFCQGRTRRWGIAWTFLPDIVTESLSKKKRKSKPLQFSFSPSSILTKESLCEVNGVDQLISKIWERIQEILTNFKVKVLSKSLESGKKVIKLHCTAEQNTWSNQRKRRREAAKRMNTRSIEMSSPVEESGDDLNSRLVSKRDEEEPVELNREKMSLSSADRKRKQSDLPDEQSNKILKHDDDIFLEFNLVLGSETLSSTGTGDDSTRVFIRMTWITGHDKNCMYQLFQYLRNICCTQT